MRLIERKAAERKAAISGGLAAFAPRPAMVPPFAGDVAPTRRRPSRLEGHTKIAIEPSLFWGCRGGKGVTDGAPGRRQGRGGTAPARNPRPLGPSAAETATA